MSLFSAGFGKTCSHLASYYCYCIIQVLIVPFLIFLLFSTMKFKIFTYLFIYLTERDTQADTSHLIIYSLHSLSIQGSDRLILSTRLRRGARNSTQVSPGVCADPSIQTITCCFSGCVFSRKRDQKLNPDSNWASWML